MSLWTEEQARFIYFYAQCTILDEHSVAQIFNGYFGTRVGYKNMAYAMQNIGYSFGFDQETLALCDEPWADPSYFGYNPSTIWKY